MAKQLTKTDASVSSIADSTLSVDISENPKEAQRLSTIIENLREDFKLSTGRYHLKLNSESQLEIHPVGEELQEYDFSGRIAKPDFRNKTANYKLNAYGITEIVLFSEGLNKDPLENPKKAVNLEQLPVAHLLPKLHELGGIKPADRSPEQLAELSEILASIEKIYARLETDKAESRKVEELRRKEKQRLEDENRRRAKEKEEEEARQQSWSAPRPSSYSAPPSRGG